MLLLSSGVACFRAALERAHKFKLAGEGAAREAIATHPECVRVTLSAPAQQVPTPPHHHPLWLCTPLGTPALPRCKMVSLTTYSSTPTAT